LKCGIYNVDNYKVVTVAVIVYGNIHDKHTSNKLSKQGVFGGTTSCFRKVSGHRMAMNKKKKPVRLIPSTTNKFVTASELTGYVINDENPVVFNQRMSDDENKRIIRAFTMKKFGYEFTDEELEKLIAFGKEDPNKLIEEYWEFFYY
jgi:hypothetical protein